MKNTNKQKNKSYRNLRLTAALLAILAMGPTCFTCNKNAVSSSISIDNDLTKNKVSPEEIAIENLTKDELFEYLEEVEAVQVPASDFYPSEEHTSVMLDKSEVKDGEIPLVSVRVEKEENNKMRVYNQPIALEDMRRIHEKYTKDFKIKSFQIQYYFPKQKTLNMDLKSLLITANTIDLSLPGEEQDQLKEDNAKKFIEYIMYNDVDLMNMKDIFSSTKTTFLDDFSKYSDIVLEDIETNLSTLIPDINSNNISEPCIESAKGLNFYRKYYTLYKELMQAETEKEAQTLSEYYRARVRSDFELNNVLEKVSFGTNKRYKEPYKLSVLPMIPYMEGKSIIFNVQGKALTNGEVDELSEYYLPYYAVDRVESVFKTFDIVSPRTKTI